jgi:hypothetical protein
MVVHHRVQIDKAYTAKRTLKLDCGHTIQTGESFTATTVYTCQQENVGPLKILMACFGMIQQKKAGQPKPPTAPEPTS